MVELVSGAKETIRPETKKEIVGYYRIKIRCPAFRLVDLLTDEVILVFGISSTLFHVFYFYLFGFKPSIPQFSHRNFTVMVFAPRSLQVAPSREPGVGVLSRPEERNQRYHDWTCEGTEATPRLHCRIVLPDFLSRRQAGH